MRNSKVKGATIPTSTAEPNEALAEYERTLKKESAVRQKRIVSLNADATIGPDDPRQKFTKIPDQLAQSDHWMRNEPIPHGLDLFPPESNLFHMRYADLFYPYAKGGRLYIDTPISKIEENYCIQKLKAYQSKGVRYTYILAQDDVTEPMLRLDPNFTLPRGNINESEPKKDEVSA